MRRQPELLGAKPGYIFRKSDSSGTSCRPFLREQGWLLEGASENMEALFLLQVISPFETEITPLIIMSELQEYDYTSATSIALCNVWWFHFCCCLSLNLMQARNSRRLRGGNA